jgi:hypothetical protein
MQPLRSQGVPLKLALSSLCIAIAMPLALSGCTSQQTYYSAQAWQRNECGKIVDQGEYQRCMSKTNTSYDDYKRQTEDTKKQ